MQIFVYEGRNRFGEKMQGQIESTNPQAVAKWLVESEIAPVAIRELPKPAEQPEWFNRVTGQDKVPALELQMLTRQLGNMVRAGMPLLVAIDGLQRSSTNKVMAKTLRAVRNDLDRGADLSTAFARHPRIFDDFYVNMVRVGENAGKLDEAFRALFKQIEFDREITKRVKSAVRYPAFVLSALAIGMTVLMAFVIPTFAQTYVKFGSDLPLLTRVLIGISNFMRNYWWVILGVLALIWIAFNSWATSKQGRYVWDRSKTRFPVIGRIVSKASVARFCRNFAMASRSGVPITQALDLSARVTGNEFYMQRVMHMRRGVERGETFTRVSTAAGIFSTMELQMLSVGEATGDVPEMMDQISQIHSEDVAYEVSKISETVEPILLGVMGIMVMVLLLGVFLPMWSLGQAALHPTGR